MRCFKCGISEDQAQLYDAIIGSGIVKVCPKCSYQRNYPLIKTPTINDSSNIGQETSLRALVDSRFNRKQKAEVKKRDDLVDNFHWVIMRARRSRKLSQDQLAKEIGESETTIKMAEKGMLPNGDYKLVSKLETVLRIKILKRKAQEELEKQKLASGLELDPVTTKVLTISDLVDMKKEKESEILGDKPNFGLNKRDLEFLEEEYIDDVEEETINLGKKDLNQKEMDRIIFGRK